MSSTCARWFALTPRKTHWKSYSTLCAQTLKGYISSYWVRYNNHIHWVKLDANISSTQTFHNNFWSVKNKNCKTTKFIQSDVITKYLFITFGREFFSQKFFDVFRCFLNLKNARIVPKICWRYSQHENTNLTRSRPMRSSAKSKKNWLSVPQLTPAKRIQ